MLYLTSMIKQLCSHSQDKLKRFLAFSSAFWRNKNIAIVMTPSLASVLAFGYLFVRVHSSKKPEIFISILRLLFTCKLEEVNTSSYLKQYADPFQRTGDKKIEIWLFTGMHLFELHFYLRPFLKICQRCSLLVPHQNGNPFQKGMCPQNSYVHSYVLCPHFNAGQGGGKKERSVLRTSLDLIVY